jgi:RNA polymerase-binding transcription factor
MQKTPDARLQRLWQILDRERTHAYDRIREFRDEQQQDAAPSPSDELDEARSLAEIETHAGVNEREEDRLKVIEDALSRLERNRYGLCEGCGNEIPTERLQAMPFAAYCVQCQRKRSNEFRRGEGSIDEASSKLWAPPMEMDESLETQDALLELEERLVVHDKEPFGSELGEFEQLPSVATARRRGRIKQRHRED